MNSVKTKRILTAIIAVSILFVHQHLFSQTILIQPGQSDGKDVMIDTTYTLNPQLWYIPQGHQITIGFGIDWCYPDGFNVICHEKLLVDFNLIGISDTAFTSAKIVLYTNTNSPNSYFHTSNFSVSNIISAWDENTVTWLSRPKIDTSEMIYFSTNDTINNDSIVIDITSLAKNKIAYPDSSFGFAISYIGWDTIGSAFVYSSEYIDSTKHPKLVVTYPDTLTGLLQIINNNWLTLYPNPFNTDLSIALQTENTHTATLTITGITGNIIYRKEEINLTTCYTKVLDLSYLPDGIYFVAVKCGDKMVTKRVVKQ